MRFLHTADLHIGKFFADMSMLEDQKKALDSLVDIAVSRGVDAVLISGDVYQRAAPQAEAMELFDLFVSKLTQAGKKLFIISGNHDSAQRISYFSRLISASGVYVSESFDGRLQTHKLSDGHGEIYIHLLPYVTPSMVRLKCPDAKIGSYTEAIKTVIERSEVDFSKRNVLIAHQFITGGESSDSEEKSVGTLDNVDAGVFEGFDYVALGHLHRPQRISSENIRYAGSPLKYSFSEVNDRKSAVLIDLKAKGDVGISLVPVPQPREVRLISGALDELISQPYSEDYIWATVTDEDVPVDAQRLLRTVYPHMARYSVSNSKTKLDREVRGAEAVENMDAERLFKDFYAYQNNGVEPGEIQLKLFRRLFNGEDKTK